MMTSLEGALPPSYHLKTQVVRQKAERIQPPYHLTTLIILRVGGGVIERKGGSRGVLKDKVVRWCGGKNARAKHGKQP